MNEIPTGEIYEVIVEEMFDKRGIDPDPYYSHAASGGGAAWHAVGMARADRIRD